ncbi:MAG: protein kinase, partial [Ignavibacteriae bacterium]|nr:protein kinase [Ignavibacteriota bacterium]
IYAIEETKNEMFIVMELINGVELKDKIKSGFENEDEKQTIARQIAEGLKTAHKKGIIHRDIKSSNIMINVDGRVKIMDFGLAKIGLGKEVSAFGSTIGTAAYMSPEQARGEDVNQQADIWSFGVVLYEMFTGELPFSGQYDQAIIYSILNEQPEILDEIESNVTIKKIIHKALEKDCNKRYNQISELLEDLDSAKPSEVSNNAEIKKLAVLPFSNIMNDPQTNFLGFALADQIIGSMAYSSNVLIRPSSSVRKYQNEFVDVKEAGIELNVNYILAGNYLKESDTIRLNIELIDLNTDQMIWREPIEIQYKNVFELQDIVSQKVVSGLKIQFSEEERERMKPEAPQNQMAYEFYLRAISYPTSVEGNKKAINKLNDAIKLDPNYAPAYMELGSRYNQLSQVGTSTAVAQKKAEDSFLKALSLNENLIPALANLGMHYTDSGRHEEAHNMIIRALKINPNDPYLHFALSYHYRYVGFLEESKNEATISKNIDSNNSRFRSSIITDMFLGNFDEILETYNLDLQSPFSLNYLGEVAFRAGKKDLAKNYLTQVIDMKDEIGEFYFANSLVEFMNGNIDKATEYNLKRELENPTDSEIFYEIARIYGLLSKPEDCERALRKAIDLGYVSYPSMQNDSFLNTVREDEGIKNLLNNAKMIHEELKKKLLTTY